MNPEQARARLRGAADDEEPAEIDLPLSVLPQLTRDDLPERVYIQVGTMRDRCLHLDWNGRLYNEGGFILGEADHTWTRKYWYSPRLARKFTQVDLGRGADVARRAQSTGLGRSRTA